MSRACPRAAIRCAVKIVKIIPTCHPHLSNQYPSESPFAAPLPESRQNDGRIDVTRRELRNVNNTAASCHQPQQAIPSVVAVACIFIARRTVRQVAANVKPEGVTSPGATVIAASVSQCADDVFEHVPRGYKYQCGASRLMVWCLCSCLLPFRLSPPQIGLVNRFVMVVAIALVPSV